MATINSPYITQDSMRFCLQINGQSEGPFTVEEIEDLHGAGRVNHSTPCRPETKGDWSSIYNLVPTAKGVFITTSDFTQTAKDYAKSVQQKLILIDGARLAALMIEHNIGVTAVRTISIKRIDSDYFEEN